LPGEEAVAQAIFGTPDVRGMALFFRLKLVTHLIGSLLGAQRKEDALPHARIRILIWLMAEKQRGNEAGLLPSELSDHLGVSRNTVSTLLNGLEAQGLIARQLHPDDRRQWLIRLTPDGETLVRQRAPEFAAFVGSLFQGLSEQEQQTLLTLLDRLYQTLAQRVATSPAGTPPP
jgi:DNA-binding MarR family transcriptional regulator